MRKLLPLLIVFISGCEWSMVLNQPPVTPAPRHPTHIVTYMKDRQRGLCFAFMEEQFASHVCKTESGDHILAMTEVDCKKVGL